MGLLSVFTVFVVVIYVFGAVDKTSSSFSAHGKIGNFIIIIIIIITFCPNVYEGRREPFAKLQISNANGIRSTVNQ